MIQNTRFTNNWNGKLHCRALTTIRLLNPKKYAVGTEHDIWLGEERLGCAQVVVHEATSMSQLDERTCLLDTGYNKAATRKILTRMYKRPEDAELSLSLVTFYYLDAPLAPNK